MHMYAQIPDLHNSLVNQILVGSLIWFTAVKTFLLSLLKGKVTMCASAEFMFLTCVRACGENAWIEDISSPQPVFKRKPPIMARTQYAIKPIIHRILQHRNAHICTCEWQLKRPLLWCEKEAWEFVLHFRESGRWIIYFSVLYLKETKHSLAHYRSFVRWFAFMNVKDWQRSKVKERTIHIGALNDSFWSKFTFHGPLHLKSIAGP